MLNLSDSSIRKVMECVDSHCNNRKTLCSLRKCSFQMNKVAVQNDFHRLEASLTFFFNNADTTDEKMSFGTFIGRGTSDFVRAQRNQLDSLEHIDRDDFLQMREAMNVFDPWNINGQWRSYTIDETATNLDILVKQALKDVELKLRSIDALKVIYAELNTELLNSLKKCSSQICFANTVHIDSCTIKWTEEELSEFLQLFKNLKNVELTGKFDKPVVTDEHLSLVSDHIVVCNEQYNVPSFPGITSKSCQNLLNSGIRRIEFLNIATGLSITDIARLLDGFIAKNPKQGLCFIMKHRCNFNFGVLQYSEYRAVVLAQRNKGTEWALWQSECNPDRFQVSYKESHVSYEFQIQRPYEHPDFVKMLEMILLLRGEAEVENFNIDRLSFIEERASNIHIKLIDYQNRNNLPEPQYQLDDEEQGFGMNEDEEQINDENFPRFWRRQILADINRIERVIRLRMEPV